MACISVLYIYLMKTNIGKNVVYEIDSLETALADYLPIYDIHVHCVCTNFDFF